MRKENLITKSTGETCVPRSTSVIRTITNKRKNTKNIAVYFAAMFFLCLGLSLNAQQFNIDQVRNGSAASPTSPAAWVNGNLNPQQAHYVEGYSVPYRVIATDLTAGVPVTICIGYDTKDNDKNALDYLTYFDRIDEPGTFHNPLFGHVQEVIDPTIGVTGLSATIDYEPITVPDSILLASNQPAGAYQPSTSFRNLAANDKRFTIFGGTFVDGSFMYVQQDPITLDDAHSKTVIQITFIPDGSTAVIAWGGHIASRLDWGYIDGEPNSAGGIEGSPYHMRLTCYIIAGDTTVIGRQDRSLQAAAVAAPPPVCQVIPETHRVCLGDSAEFLASATSGTAPYTFEWFKGNDFSTVIASTATLTISNAAYSDTGTYQVIVTDDMGMMDTCMGRLLINPPPPCSIDNVPSALICNTGTDSISTNLSAATYSFDWDMAVDGSPSGWAIVGDDTLQELKFTQGDCGSAGFMVNFTLTVTNRETGCMTVCSLSIAPRAPQCAVDIRPADTLTCSLTSQYLLASYSTEIINPAVEWTRNGVSLGAGLNDSINGLDSILITEPGIYRFTVTDTANSSNTCFAQDTVMQDSAKPILSETHINVSCKGGDNGSIDLSVTGGTSPFTFEWSNGETTEDIDTLIAGEYEVFVVGANGCADSLTVVITEPDSLNITETHTDVSCNGDSIGAIDITVTGGTSPYSYSWNNGDTAADIDSLIAGIYKVIVTDDNGCIDSAEVTITQPDDIVLSEQHVDVNCYGERTGSIDLTVTGGVTPYEYAWSNGDITEDITGLPAGTYSVLVTDANKCTDTLSVTLTEPPDVSCVIDTPDVMPNCGSSGNILEANVSGASSFVWSVVGDGWSITSGQGTDSITYDAGSGTGVFKLVLENGNGCKDSCEIEIECIPVGEFCSLTQGFYGSARGVACATGERGFTLIERLLGSPFGNLYIGAAGRSLTITQADAVCVSQKLPSGGPAAMLTVGDHVFEDCSTLLPVNKRGRFNNVLLGQTITLGLNMRLDTDLGGLVLEGTVMTTVEADPGVDGQCGTEDDVPIPSLVTVRYIPVDVLSALDDIYGSTSVEDLFNLANRALGGLSTGDADFSEINQAVSAINEGFDHCKFLQGFSSPGITERMIETMMDETNEVRHYAYPNPFDVSTTIEFISKTDAEVSVEIFSVDGQKVESLFNGNVAAGELKRVVFSNDNLPKGIYFYKIISEGTVYSSKLMLIK